VVGDPFDEGTTMGALINARQLERVTRYIQAGKNEGARLVAGGGRPQRSGYFVQPTLFADASNTMAIAREEIFGPVGTVIAFDSDDEAIAIANDSNYALAATLWTSDVSRAHTLARRVHAGAVAINGWSPLDPRLPWGGSKLSGQGRELGWPGIEANTEEKTITVIL
jgi:betaine-aldehyde dehydrogenase